MHPLDRLKNRKRTAQEEHGLGMCNITKCCTEVCPEHIRITDNAIIPMKERVVDIKIRSSSHVQWIASPRKERLISMKLIIRWAVLAFAMWIATLAVPGITVNGGFTTYFWVALLFGLINSIFGSFNKGINLSSFHSHIRTLPLCG